MPRVEKTASSSSTPPDRAHPKVVSEYTETVTGGVHSAFIDGHYVYITDGATGSLRVIDFRDVKTPKEVGRWAPDRKVQGSREQGDELPAGVDASRRPGEGRPLVCGLVA